MLFDTAGRPLMRRRAFLAASASSVLFASRGWSGDEIVVRKPKLGANPFTLGVASGDPAPDGFVIWTRLAPKPLEGGGMPNDAVAVAWEVAEDEAFQKVVRQGESIALPQLAHSVHVEVEGLAPDRWYWYRFGVGEETSPIGRSRTVPAFDSVPSEVRFAVASCQHFESGLYTAYQHMAEDELDLVLHLGDYIYEGPGKPGGVRQHVVDHELASLEDYRSRHAQYKTDEQLQRTHARFPWLVAWDDHELENNYASLISEDASVTPEEFAQRRANAYQAYYEHMPLRRASLPAGPDMKIYRRVRWGQLADFNMLDTRQYRSNQPNGDGGKPLYGEVFNPRATMLGRRQENWLYQGLLESPCRWNVLAQQVMMARVDMKPGPEGMFGMDIWSGYDAPRKRLLDFLATRRVANPVVLTGDIHSNWCNDLLVDFDKPDGPVVGSEFVATSISSSGDSKKTSPEREEALKENPFVKFFSLERGYVRCAVSPKLWKSDYQAVEYVTRPGAPLETRKSFVIEAGQAGVKPA
jgi:alkaline phosphatase D